MLGFQVNHFDDPRLCAHNCTTPALVTPIFAAASTNGTLEDTLLDYQNPARRSRTPIVMRECLMREGIAGGRLGLVLSTGPNTVFNAMHEFVTLADTL
jgi:hypothetical protein